jgi:hypothetical protein
MNIPLTSFTLTDGTPLGRYADSSPGFDGGALRWANVRNPPAIVTMVGVILDDGQRSDVRTGIHLGALRIGSSDSPTFDVTLTPMVAGRTSPGDPVKLTSAPLSSAGFQRIEASGLVPTDAATVCFELSICPTASTLDSDDVALLGVEWDRRH